MRVPNTMVLFLSINVNFIFILVNLMELSNTEKNQVVIAHQEFDIINNNIMKKFIETQELPFLP